MLTPAQSAHWKTEALFPPHSLRSRSVHAVATTSSVLRIAIVAFVPAVLRKTEQRLNSRLQPLAFCVAGPSGLP